jgi:SAM-dependent methyltransferase
MDPYAGIAELYDREHDAFRPDVRFYQNLIQEGPVLEVGCGSGRVLKPLAEAGLEVYGIDPSAAMLERARRRLQHLRGAHLIHGNIEDLQRPLRFNAVIWPLNVLWHLADADAQLRALQITQRHCAPGALVVVDLSNPLSMADRGAAGEVRLRFEARENEQTVQGFSSAHDDEADQTLRLSLWYDIGAPDGTVRRSHTSLDLRYLYRSELQLMLEMSDLHVASVYGSYDLDEYSSSSPGIIAVARASH